MATFYAPGPPNTAYSPDTKYIAKGSFGCVVEPGLPNKGPDDKWEQFPKNVSKIFKNKITYNRALNSTKKAHNLMGKNNAHRMNTYKYSYLMANSLPERIVTNCELKPSNPIYVTRMPNLGLSFDNLNGNMDAIDKLHRVSFITILKQIEKVLDQVDKLQKANYVHGDIREANVMIDPKDGVISIIDFDWLLPKHSFFREFPLGFYNSPPETMVRKYIVEDNIYKESELVKIKQEIEQIYNNTIYRNNTKKWLIVLINYFNNSNKYFINSNVGHSLGLTRDILKNTIIKAIEYYANIIKYKRIQSDINDKLSMFHDTIFKTYDSYSIGFSILYLMNILYPGNITTNSSKMSESLKGKLYNELVEYNESTLNLIAKAIVNIKNAMANLCNIDMTKRTTIDKALKVVKDEIEKLEKPIEKSEEELKGAEEVLKAIPVPLPAPAHPVPTAPPMTPNTVQNAVQQKLPIYPNYKNNTNNKNNNRNTRKKVPNLPNSANSLILSATPNKK